MLYCWKYNDVFLTFEHAALHQFDCVALFHIEF